MASHAVPTRRFGHRSCKPSVITVLLWNIVVSCTYNTAVVLQAADKIFFRTHLTLSGILGLFSLVGIEQMLYPVGGLLADLCCGRYKVIGFSMLAIWCGNFLSCVGSILLGKLSRDSLFVMVLVIICVFTVSFTGFKSNSVQFSLDQLLEASSEQISIFLHWFVWTEHVGELVRLLIIIMPCFTFKQIKEIAVGSCSVIFISSTACMLLSYFSRKSVYRERTSSNPYRSVWKVLHFAVTHDKPLGHRSAFTYSDDEKPRRIDFAKRIYGGQYETEVVENVKTFLRIVLMLFAATLVFLLQVPTFYLFPLFGLYLGKNVTVDLPCSYEWILFESGFTSSFVSVVAIPSYLLLVYPLIKKWLPKIITRLGVGIALMAASAISMFVIYTIATYSASKNSLTNSTCLFIGTYHFFYKHHAESPTLEFPTQVLIITNLLQGLAAPLINIGILEFISAQSPHTMKGLLLGVFYAFRGFFVMLGSVLTLPFVQKRLWVNQHWLLDCGFICYLSNSLLGMLGLVVFVLAARCYRYRERDDPPYRHQYAEDYYSRYTSQPAHRLIDGHDMQASYGTMNV